MNRTPEHQEGYRRAAKDAVEWLHTLATEMKDDHAKQVLNSAATNLGWHFSRIEAHDRKEILPRPSK